MVRKCEYKGISTSFRKIIIQHLIHILGIDLGGLFSLIVKWNILISLESFSDNSNGSLSNFQGNEIPEMKNLKFSLGSQNKSGILPDNPINKLHEKRLMNNNSYNNSENTDYSNTPQLQKY